MARSALSASCALVDGESVGSIPAVARFIMGMRNLRPQVSRYASPWDVDLVLGYVASMWPLEALSFERLSKRMVILFLLATSQRVQKFQILFGRTMIGQ